MRHLPLAAAALLLAAAHAHAAGPRAGTVEVAQPWSRPAVAGSSGAGFMTLINHGRAPAVLTGAESPAAARVEIHRSDMAGGVMRMARQAQVAVPAGGRVTFAPGGYHLMLIGLKAPLKAGDSVPATLTFADGARLKVAFAVGSGQAPAAMDHMRH